MAGSDHVRATSPALGEVFTAPYDVVFSEHDVVEPDLVYFSAERASQVIELLRETGDVLETPLLPSLQLPLKTIFKNT